MLLVGARLRRDDSCLREARITGHPHMMRLVRCCLCILLRGVVLWWRANFNRIFLERIYTSDLVHCLLIVVVSWLVHIDCCGSPLSKLCSYARMLHELHLGDTSLVLRPLILQNLSQDVLLLLFLRK